VNHLGTRALVLTQTEVDTTGKSYYGETNLYFLDSQGKHDCRVVLGIQIRCNLCRARKAAGSNVILQLAPVASGPQTRRARSTTSRGAPTRASLSSSTAVRSQSVFGA